MITLVELLDKSITLNEVLNEDYFIGFYNEKEIKVRMNDFPDEILYTVFFLGKEMDLEDIPEAWHILYLDKKLKNYIL